MPQIELMQSDLPHTLFKSKDKKKKTPVVEDDEAIRLTKMSLERKRARESKERSFTIEEVFNGNADE